jgi:hypothetical protein
MSLNNILQPNDFDLYGNSLVSPEFVKTNSINTTDPERLLIGNNTSTFEGIDFGTLGSAATYTFNGIPFVPGSGAASVGPPVNATDNNVLQITGTTINAEFATATRPGVVSATSQSFLGDKTIVGNIAATNLSGTNTGDVTLTAVGSSPNANSASLSGQALTLQPASFLFPGIMTTGTQGFNGDKTFQSSVTSNTFIIPTTTALNTGTIQQNGSQFLHSFGTNGCVFLGLGAGNFTGTPNASVGIGNSSLSSITSGSSDVCLGYEAGRLLDAGSRNTLLGAAAGGNLTSGNNNICIGQVAGGTANTMTNGIIIGRASGPSLTSESNLIEISDGTIGATPSNGINIGMLSSNSCMIRGIAGISPASPDGMVIIDSSTHKLGTTTYVTTTSNFTMTLDIGTITSSTVRGASTAVLDMIFSRTGSAVSITISNFSITGQSAAALTINLTGVGAIPANVRPTYSMMFPCLLIDNGVFSSAIIYLTSGGLMSLQLQTGLPFTLPTGPSPYDISISYNIV